MEKPYSKHVSYLFEVHTEVFELVSFTWGESLYFKETRCNGQEDTHVSGELFLVDGKWVWEHETPEGIKLHTPDEYTSVKHIDMYQGEGMAAAIKAFFNKNGLPEDDKNVVD